VYSLLIIHLATTLFMTGLIWFVQVVHYPLFDAVRENYPRFAARHQNRTAYVVIPTMLAEGITGIVLTVHAPTTTHIIGLVLIGLIWLGTFTLSVPCHQRLMSGFDAATHRRLVATNWLRTGLWTARSLLLLLTLG